MAKRGNNLERRMDQLTHRLATNEKSQKGFKQVPPDHPTTFVKFPWNSYIYESTGLTTNDATEVIVTMQSLLTGLTQTVNIASEDRVKLKIQKAQCWCTTNTTLIFPQIDVMFHETSQSDKQPRNTQKDSGNWNKPAKAGYVYPLVDRSEIYTLADKDRKVVTVTAANAGTEVIIRVHMLWKTGPILP